MQNRAVGSFKQSVIVLWARMNVAAYILCSSIIRRLCMVPSVFNLGSTVRNFLRVVIVIYNTRCYFSELRGSTTLDSNRRDKICFNATNAASWDLLWVCESLRSCISYDSVIVLALELGLITMASHLTGQFSLWIQLNNTSPEKTCQNMTWALAVQCEREVIGVKSRGLHLHKNFWVFKG